MKILFKISLFLVFSISSAQDIKIKDLSETEARTFADQVAKLAVTKWEFVKAKANRAGDYYTVKYINNSLPKDVKEGVKNGDTCDDCFNITFLINQQAKTLTFYEATGTYADLFPTWKKFFRPDADQQKTANDPNSQELINKPAGVNVKFKEDQDSWHITNWL